MNTDLEIADKIVNWCVHGGHTLAVAESCTGGLIAHRITHVPGASAVFHGGIVAYANQAKIALLNVPESVLLAHGAVSELVALEMAQGVRHLFNVDYSVSATGIAGPGGGTAEKPVGLVYIAAAGPTATRVCRHHFSGDRPAVKEQSAQAALSLLLEVMELT